MNKFDRYSRQIFIEEVSIEGQRAIQDAKVLVIGVGGLGSAVIPYLVAAGVGNLGIVDSDIVELHNLNRQIMHTEEYVGTSKIDSAKKFIQSLNSSIHVEFINKRITSCNAIEIVNDYDIVVDGSDNFETKYLINDVCIDLGKILVYGSIFKFEGQVAVFNFQGSKDLRAIFPEPPSPEAVPNCDMNGVLGPLPGVIGSMMAMLVLQIIVRMPIPRNQLMLFDLKIWKYSNLLF